MILLYVLGAVLLALLAIPYVVGLVLRDEYDGLVHVVLPLPLERVWAEMHDYARHPVSGWMARSILPAEEGPDGAPAGLAWTEDLGNTRIHVRTVDEEPLRRWELVMKDAVVPMTSHWVFEFEAHPEGTLVRALNRTVVRSGSWRSPVFRLVLARSGATEKVLREYFRMIAASLGVASRVVPPTDGPTDGTSDGSTDGPEGRLDPALPVA